MSQRQSVIPRPGPARITLVLLFAVPAAMAYPWTSTWDRWVLGLAVAAVIVLLSWWHGLHLTTLLRRRVAMLRPGRRPRAGRRPGIRTTVALRLVPAAGDPALPFPLLASYLDRYGVRADAVRVTSRDVRAGAGAPVRDTWIGLTFAAIDNLTALQARSAQIPLRETAEVAVRRLADHLREMGWETVAARPEEVPDLFGVATQETWYGLTDGSDKYVTGYQVAVDDSLPDSLADIWDCGARQVWTAVEIAGNAEHRTIAAGCALTTDEGPPRTAPLPGLTPENGNHRAALQILHPLSGQRLAGHTELPPEVIAALRWLPGLVEQADPART